MTTESREAWMDLAACRDVANVVLSARLSS
jgi:hypothetical protein